MEWAAVANFLSQPPKGGVMVQAARKAPLAIGSAALIAVGIVAVALILQKGR